MLSLLPPSTQRPTSRPQSRGPVRTTRCISSPGNSDHPAENGVRLVPHQRSPTTTAPLLYPRRARPIVSLLPRPFPTPCGVGCSHPTHRSRCSGRFVTLAHECFLTCSSEQPGAAHMFPQRRDGRCKRWCSRRRLSIHSLPRARARARATHTLPRRQPRGCDGPRDGERWRGRSRGRSCEARCRTRRSRRRRRERCNARGEHGAKRRREHRPTRGGP